ncbi:hypothetical protein [Iningainema tapete]|uniref:Uncharacterized protein n=1 Tax=Iningainema tapete BLCC-T55 TaxID=2748662 RepID=A0A8J6XQT7_9CYAN|nr:hypothetical protein [Iningainema tapete]MBD2776590.1 hypothetical protein [Iningainema tapete BLCC-T55]
MKPTNNDNNPNQPQQWQPALLLTILAALGLKLIWGKAGRTLVVIWNWLWGIPIESGGEIAVEVAGESLKSMQQSVAKLAESVATAIAAYENAKGKYELKQQEFKVAEN